MKHKEGFFKGPGDADIYYQYWTPDQEPKGIILVIHGLAEHSGRYMNLVNFIVPRGYGVYSLDHIGHGKSSGKRAYIEKFKDFTDTIKIYFDMLRKWHQEIPIIILGHSMGGLITSNYLLDYQSELTGAILSGPPVKVPENLSRLSIISGNIISGTMPGLGLMKIDPNDVSRDKLVVQAYIDDPLVYKGRIPARLLAELIKGMQRITANVNKITLPFFIVHGGADKLAEPLGSQSFFDNASSKSKDIKIYEGLYHEVLNEPEHEQVLMDIAVFLSKYTNRN